MAQVNKEVVEVIDDLKIYEITGIFDTSITLNVQSN